MIYIFYPPDIQSQMGSYRATNKDPSDHPQKPKKPSSRKNPWGNRSYADLITQAIQNAPEKRLTLSEIYEWMVKNVPHFKDKGENNSSAAWKNSIRHNLSLHTQFVRIQNEGTGKSSWWVIDPTAGEGRATRRRYSNKGNKVRPFRKHRPKPKTKPPKNKGLAAFHNPAFVNNFRHHISQSGTHFNNKYNDVITVPSYIPYALHLADNQRQRWHSSSSCSSEEFGCNEVSSYRRFSPEFLQPSPPYSDRSASEICSLDHETEDFTVPNQPQTYQNGYYERNTWYKMPSTYCSSEQIDGISHTSRRNFWNEANEIVQNSASFIHKAGILSDVYGKDSSLCIQQVNAFLNVKNSDTPPEDIVSEEQKRYSYEHLDDHSCSHDPDYLRDMDMPPLTLIEYSSQHPSEDDNIYYSTRRNLQGCSEIADLPSTYHHGSSLESSDGSICNHFYVHKSDSPTNEESPLLPPDLRSCEVSVGLDCDIAEIFQIEIDVEGSLAFLESFDTCYEI